MDLQKKLIQLSSYRCSFKYVESFVLISMTYPENWNIIPSEDKTIEVGEDNGVTYYAAPIEVDIEKTFQLIDDTISYNLDVEKKMALLKYNIGKLQEYFAEKDLDELETIEFVFKKKPTTKSTSAKKKLKENKPTTLKVEKSKLVEDSTTEEAEYKLESYEEATDVFFNEEQECNVSEVTASCENKYLEEIER